MEGCLALLFLLKGEWTLPEIKIVGRGVDTLILNVHCADKQFQPIKQELDADLQEELNTLQGEARINESAVVTNSAFKGFALYMQPKGLRGQWRGILTCARIASGGMWLQPTSKTVSSRVQSGKTLGLLMLL